MEIIVLSCTSALLLMSTHFLDYLRAPRLPNRPAWHAMPLALTPLSSAPFEPRTSANSLRTFLNRGVTPRHSPTDRQSRMEFTS
jgi:hypothetical protein